MAVSDLCNSYTFFPKFSRIKGAVQPNFVEYVPKSTTKDYKKKMIFFTRRKKIWFFFTEKKLEYYHKVLVGGNSKFGTCFPIFEYCFLFVVIPNFRFDRRHFWPSGSVYFVPKFVVFSDDGIPGLADTRKCGDVREVESRNYFVVNFSRKPAGLRSDRRRVWNGNSICSVQALSLQICLSGSHRISLHYNVNFLSHWPTRNSRENCK